jgi:hypothetical protein
MELKMKKVLSAIFFLLAFTVFASAQNYQLTGQSPDGKSLKIEWFIKKWDASVTGFDIKRRIKNGPWVKVNSAPVIPELSLTKDISIVEPDATEQARLKEKLKTSFNASRLKEVKADEYLSKLKNDQNALAQVAIICGMDFDLALLNGFALVDRNIPSADVYEYGLFIAGGSKLLTNMTWKYGEKPDLAIISNIYSRSTPKKTRMQLIWQTDKEKTSRAMLAGFYIYRNGARLNDAPRMAVDDASKMLYSVFDSGFSLTEPTRYEISAQSIFGIEGPRSSFEYKPSEHPSEYKNASVVKIESEGENFAGGIALNWLFPDEYERYLKGFKIEKANLPAGYTVISAMEQASSRKFIDKTPTAVAAYVKYKVTALYIDGTEAPSYEMTYYYLPKIKPPRPQHVKAELIVQDKRSFAKLSWDEKAPGDTLTEYYIVFASNPVTGQFMQDIGLPKIKENSFMYELEYGQAAKYKFAIMAVSKYITHGDLSDTVVLQSPSAGLPYIKVSSLNADSNKVTIVWTYPEIWDVKGFRIYQNGNMVANENQVNKSARQFTTPGLKWGASYEFSVQAVTEYGVLSEISMPSTIIIQQEKK